MKTCRNNSRTGILAFPFHLLLAAPLLLLMSACGLTDDADDDAPDQAAESAVDEDWKLVQAYIDLSRAWHARDNEIRQSDVSAEEKERQRKEERGEHPDIVLAVVAARKLAAGDGERAFDGARFLIEHTRGLSPTEASDMQFGNAALVRLVGPDWSVVEAYNEAFEAWKVDDEQRREEFRSDANEGKPFFLISPPESLQAMAAAQAILKAGPDPEKASEAAEFLVDLPTRNAHAMLSGARALADRLPDFGEWPELLMKIDSMRPGGTSESIDEFLAEMASKAEDPIVRATARYFGAKGLVDSVNHPSLDAAQRETRRTQALEMATGLSTGVETEEFIRKTMIDGEQVSRTLADAEALLVHGIRHTVVGATVADEVGRRLDGTEERLSAYVGKVVLMDFWATWCGPCIAALPEMRELAEEYPDDRFEILSISVDAEAETVTTFLEDQPMPWAHWHVGVGSDLGTSWRIPGYPTYIVIDPDGVILSRGHKLATAVKSIEQAVSG